MPLTAIRHSKVPQSALLKDILSFIEQQKQLGLILHRGEEFEAESLWSETLRERIQSRNGQFISLNLRDFGEASFAGVLTAALDDTGSGYPFCIDLPLILQNNPNTESPFVNRAILWQHLCDKIITDENSERPTVLLLENIGQAGKRIQHDIARQIRFHTTYRIRRTFLLTVRKNEIPRLEPELRELAAYI